jgi:hypothetical protein
MTDLKEACTELGRWLGEAHGLLHQPDTGENGGSRYGALHEPPGSAPPWNAAVADAYLTAFFGIRRLEADWRQLRGLRAHRRGGSPASTYAALSQVPAMETAVSDAAVKDGLRRINHWITRIRQLRAIDEAPQWIRLRAGKDGLPPACPHCDGLGLRMAEGRGVVACFTPGCEDLDGRQPMGLLGFSRLDGSPMLAWHDGLITYTNN